MNGVIVGLVLFALAVAAGIVLIAYERMRED